MSGQNRRRTNSGSPGIDLGSHKLTSPTEHNMRPLFPNLIWTREGAPEQDHVAPSLLARTEQPSLLRRISPVKSRMETLEGADRALVDVDGDVQMKSEDDHYTLGRSHTDLADSIIASALAGATALTDSVNSKHEQDPSVRRSSVSNSHPNTHADKMEDINLSTHSPYHSMNRNDINEPPQTQAELVEQAKQLLIPIITQNARLRDPDADIELIKARVMSLITEEQCLDFLKLAKDMRDQMHGSGGPGMASSPPRGHRLAFDGSPEPVASMAGHNHRTSRSPHKSHGTSVSGAAHSVEPRAQDPVQKPDMRRTEWPLSTQLTPRSFNGPVARFTTPTPTMPPIRTQSVTPGGSKSPPKAPKAMRAAMKRSMSSTFPLYADLHVPSLQPVALESPMARQNPVAVAPADASAVVDTPTPPRYPSEARTTEDTAGSLPHAVVESIEEDMVYEPSGLNVSIGVDNPDGLLPPVKIAEKEPADSNGVAESAVEENAQEAKDVPSAMVIDYPDDAVEEEAVSSGRAESAAEENAQEENAQEAKDVPSAMIIDQDSNAVEKETVSNGTAESAVEENAREARDIPSALPIDPPSDAVVEEMPNDDKEADEEIFDLQPTVVNEPPKELTPPTDDASSEIKDDHPTGGTEPIDVGSKASEPMDVEPPATPAIQEEVGVEVEPSPTPIASADATPKEELSEITTMSSTDVPVPVQPSSPATKNPAIEQEEVACVNVPGEDGETPCVNASSEAAVTPNIPLHLPILLHATTGSSSPDVTDIVFEVDDGLAVATRRWGARQTSWDPSAAYASVFLLCLPTAEVRSAHEQLGLSASAEEYADALWNIRTRWPQQGKLLIDINQGKSTHVTFIPRQLGPHDGPLDVSSYIQQGKNTVQLIQLADSSAHMFMLLARRPPARELKWQALVASFAAPSRTPTSSVPPPASNSMPTQTIAAF